MDPASIDTNNPWPWLDPFTEVTAIFFTGRDDDVLALERCVFSAAATVLFGKSGLGKTSLLQAGLSPRLRAARMLPVLVRLEHGEGSRSIAQIMEAQLLTECAANGLTPPGNLGEVAHEECYRQPQEKPRDQAAAVRLWLALHTLPLGLWDADLHAWHPVFILDQFEEIFTHGANDTDRQQLEFDTLADLIENRLPGAVESLIRNDAQVLDGLDPSAQPYRVVLSLREDYLPDLEGWCQFIPRLAANRYRLLPMGREQAIEATRRTGGELVTAEAAEDIVEYVAGQQDSAQGPHRHREIEPALLSLVCAGLNAERLQQDKKQIDTSDLVRRSHRILERFYADAMNDIGDELRSVVEDKMITLDGSRLVYPLKAVMERTEITLAEVNKLIDRRLLRKDVVSNDDRIEIVHDRIAAVALQHRAEREQAAEQRRTKRIWDSLSVGSEADLERSPETSGPLRGCADNNLPRLQEFVGRERELPVIQRAIERETRAWGALINGPAGIGKTALAIHAAGLTLPQRFRQILFLPCGENGIVSGGTQLGSTFVIPDELALLNTIAREIKHPELAQSVKKERRALILHELKGRDVLLILDNLDALRDSDRTFLFEFLERLPLGCSAIVTTRDRYSANGAFTVSLDKLGGDDTLLLFKQLADIHSVLSQGTDDETIRLCEATDGHPLRIRLITGQLGRGHFPTVAAALQILNTIPHDQEPEEVIFRHILESLNEQDKRILLALSCFPGNVEGKYVAQLASVEPQEVYNFLRATSANALATSDPAGERFALLPMLADFLRGNPPKILTDLSSQLKRTAHELIDKNGRQNYSEFGKLEDSWPLIAAALPIFLTGENRELQEICDWLHVFLDFQGHWDEWLYLNQKAEERAVNSGDYVEAGWRALQAGRVFRLRHEADCVFDSVASARKHWEKTRQCNTPGQTSRAREEGNAYILEGKGHYLQKDYDSAMKCFEQARSRLQSLSEDPTYPLQQQARRDFASALNGLADAYRFSKNLDVAEKYYQQALELADKNVHDQAAYTGNLAALEIDRENWPHADELAKKALRLAKEVGRQELIATNYRRLSEICMGLRNRTEGREYAMKAAEIYARLGSYYQEIGRRLLNQWHQ